MFDIGGATAVKHHPFFEGIDWAKLVALQVEPPLKPELTSQTDTSNFSAEFVDMTLPRSLSRESLLSHAASLEPPGEDEAGEMFRGFSFVADSFIDERDRQDGQENGFSFFEDGNDGPHAGVARVGGDPPKKVKGKRIRKKKVKGVQATATIDGASTTDTSGVERVDGDRGATLSRGDVRTPLFVREPVGEVESKPSTLAAMLMTQQKDKSLRAPNVDPPRPQRPNVWGASSLPAPAPVPTPGRYSAEGGSSTGRRLPPQDVKGLPGHRANGSNTFVWKRPV